MKIPTQGQLPGRQVHLDFHTSPHLPEVAADFDAGAFASTMEDACVNSVTIFAKCHHGYAYFPSRVCTPHPQLAPAGRDLLGEQIVALHRRRIRCPIYITVGWDALLTQSHPEWRPLGKDGKFVDWNSGHPGQWKFVNWLHPQVQQHIEDLTREIIDRYGDEVDGFFYDICFLPKGACWSPESRKFRARHHLWDDTTEGFERFQAKAQEIFAARFWNVIHGALPDATVFFNAGSDSFLESGLGCRARYPYMSHMEIESLPSGFWGYYHFPRLARSTGHWGKPWLGMTGRFQTLWGDFGGIKPQPALEYECFRAQALGGGNSIGDQLPPRGCLDTSAYRLIGAVYQQVRQAEAFYEGSVPLPQIGIVTSGTPTCPADETAKSDEGAIQMCEEAHFDCQLLDAESNLDDYELIILGDNTTLTPEYIEKLKNYYAKGGKLIVSYKGACDRRGNWALDFLRIKVLGEQELHPAYWRARPGMALPFGTSDRVIYQAGLVVLAPSYTILAERVLPYFQRDDIHYCSHLQTPPRPESSQQPTIVAGERFFYFADPIFREYRQYGNIAVRDAWRMAIDGLLGSAPFGSSLPSTMLVYPRRKERDLLLTLLHYIPVRKAINIDMIEERSPFAGETLHMPESVTSVLAFPEKTSLPRAADGGFLLPQRKGRLLLTVPDYFSQGEAKEESGHP